MKPEQVAVLSQYKAQCKLIEKDLHYFGYTGAKIGTVVASQGINKHTWQLSTKNVYSVFLYFFKHL